ncbi:hypothetical protein H6P81_017098 [Aristolochia fimbriata]|uniref:Fe2OG dioxygenase domain-containing protein n=1 Tax=Aristolochia fimbriata TaxID=158543 RepID=A0AAV7DXK0_ARIFI|nr:hypothetical protein H6P81_017098 [Aristolochia fimbriata]
MESNYPPLMTTYESLLGSTAMKLPDDEDGSGTSVDQLPLIDLARLHQSCGDHERKECKKEIAEASRTWGFFQVINHGVSKDLLHRISTEQMKLFRQVPFDEKRQNVKKLLSLSKDDTTTYRWGSQNAASINRLSWSEAFHIPMAALLDEYQKINHHQNTSTTNTNSLRLTIEEFGEAASDLALKLARILAEEAAGADHHSNNYFAEDNGFKSSDFLTILYQDQVGGLQLLKDDGKWITVKPMEDALIVNRGDFFQAWSNGAYKSMEHRAMTNNRLERFSVAYFMSPSPDT